MEKIKALIGGREPVRWVFSGDSITHGALHTFGLRDYTELFSERVRFEMGRGLDVVMKTAISGTRTTHVLENYDTLIGQFNPHVVFIMFGMNDCSNRNVPPDKFKGNIRLLVEKILVLGGIPVLQTTCPILPKTALEREPYFDEYMDIIRKVADADSISLIDHNASWRKNEGQQYYWMSDAIHPNEFGHLAFARLIFEELGIYDKNSNTCKLFFPGA
jgi:acyl-CoA thioesterase-1